MTSTDADPIAVVLPSVARRLEERARAQGGLENLGEVRDLEPELVLALTDALSPRFFVEKNKKIEIPNWSPVGNVDIVCRRHPGEMPAFAAELKWSKGDKVYEAIWDLFKMALLSQHPSVEAVYLVTGAPVKEWESGLGREILSDGIHRVTELCKLRFPSGRYAWDYLLEGGFDKCPTLVPSEVRTDLVASEPLDDGASRWQLRAVRLEPIGAETVPFIGGWPHGDRPPTARNPLYRGGSSSR